MLAFVEVKPQETGFYDQCFFLADRNRDGLIDAVEFASFFQETGFPYGQLV